MSWASSRYSCWMPQEDGLKTAILLQKLNKKAGWVKTVNFHPLKICGVMMMNMMISSTWTNSISQNFIEID